MKSMNLYSTALFVLLFAGAFGCDATEEDESVPQDPVESTGATDLPAGFGEYWYSGVAEISHYRLEQGRYGAMREGDAVLIFVTEDFLAEDQVKLESTPGDRPVAKVLKMNMTKSFLTGVYPYSMMTSVFTPISSDQHPATLKVTTSSQEWCGHTFTQLNRAEKGYRLRQYSYFEKEGDVDLLLEVDLLEDELWTRLRLDPVALPVGDITLVPGTMTARLRHTDHTPESAKARRVDLPEDRDLGQISRYTLEYSNPPRTLMIDYRTEFPHQIVAWSETYNDFGELLTTRGTLTDTLMLDYWSRNGVGDSVYREKLGF